MPSLTNLQDLSTIFFFLVGNANQLDFYMLRILLGLSLGNVVIIVCLPVSQTILFQGWRQLITHQSTGMWTCSQRKISLQFLDSQCWPFPFRLERVMYSILTCRAILHIREQDMFETTSWSFDMSVWFCSRVFKGFGAFGGHQGLCRCCIHTYFPYSARLTAVCIIDNSNNVHRTPPRNRSLVPKFRFWW